jgi:hypothetical protein
MLVELAAHAARHGATRIHADVLADNHAMRRLAEKTGYALRSSPSAPFVLRLTGRLPALPAQSRPIAPVTARSRVEQKR